MNSRLYFSVTAIDDFLGLFDDKSQIFFKLSSIPISAWTTGRACMDGPQYTDPGPSPVPGRGAMSAPLCGQIRTGRGIA